MTRQKVQKKLLAARMLSIVSPSAYVATCLRLFHKVHLLLLKCCSQDKAASAESELADAPSRVECPLPVLSWKVHEEQRPGSAGRDPGKVADRFFAVNLEHVSCACVSHITMPYNCIFSLYIYFHWQYTCIYMFMALSE